MNQNGITYVIAHKITGKEVKAYHSQLRPYHLPPDYILRHPYYENLLNLKALTDFEEYFISSDSGSGPDKDYSFCDSVSDQDHRGEESTNSDWSSCGSSSSPATLGGWQRTVHEPDTLPTQ